MTRRFRQQMTHVILGLLLPAALLLSPLSQGCSDDDDGEAEAAGQEKKNGAPPAQAVRVATAQSGSLTSEIPITGELLADHLVELAPLESGQLVELLVDEGDKVKTDQVVGRLDKLLENRARIEASTRLQSAEARVAAIDAELDAQRKEVERRRELVERKAFPAAELQQLEDQLAVLEQNAAVARAEQDEARSAVRSRSANIDRRVIKAPFDGIVVKRHVTRGASVGPQSPILTIIDEGSMRFVTPVAEQRIGSVSEGSKARITLDAYPGRSLDARVVEVGTLVDRESRTVDVELVIEDDSAVLPSGLVAVEGTEPEATQKPDSAGDGESGRDTAPADDASRSKETPEQHTPEQDASEENTQEQDTTEQDTGPEPTGSPSQPPVVLRHGMFGRGGIIVDEVRDATIVPAEAIVHSSDGTRVWTVVDGEAQPRDVQVVLETERKAAVTGISPGLEVIISGTQRLKPGTGVSVTSEEPSADEKSEDQEGGAE